ncbi:MAG: tRNA (5-methylaminomethyl-2-thiouridine)(34)-methyltransferase MnmD [Flavobacteriaceae bacterium]
MKREIIKTSDGSTTIHIPEWNEQYHSIHGAIQEANHVYIQQGLNYKTINEIAVLEIGFGTGLNSFMTFLKAQERKLKIEYVGVEAYPIFKEELEKLNYVAELDAIQFTEIFESFHSCSWEEKHKITPDFSLLKRKQFFHEINDKNKFDVIYFDAFGARVQPELWTEEIFLKMFLALKSGGVLVTYAAKGSVRRAMQSVGFSIERLPGPPGKREMLRATKL